MFYRFYMDVLCVMTHYYSTKFSYLDFLYLHPLTFSVLTPYPTLLLELFSCRFVLRLKVFKFQLKPKTCSVADVRK